MGFFSQGAFFRRASGPEIHIIWRMRGKEKVVVEGFDGKRSRLGHSVNKNG